MKALTLKQPWASSIFRNGKDVENRSRPTKHRGLLAIHAGAAWSNDAAVAIARLTSERYLAARQSAIVGTVQVVGCHHAKDCEADTLDGQIAYCSQWAMAGLWHWDLADPRPLAEPVEMSGRLGIWNISLDLDEVEILHQTGGLL